MYTLRVSLKPHREFNDVLTGGGYYCYALGLRLLYILEGSWAAMEETKEGERGFRLTSLDWDCWFGLCSRD